MFTWKCSIAQSNLRSGRRGFPSWLARDRRLNQLEQTGSPQNHSPGSHWQIQSRSVAHKHLLSTLFDQYCSQIRSDLTVFQYTHTRIMTLIWRCGLLVWISTRTITVNQWPIIINYVLHSCEYVQWNPCHYFSSFYYSIEPLRLFASPAWCPQVFGSCTGPHWSQVTISMLSIIECSKHMGIFGWAVDNHAVGHVTYPFIIIHHLWRSAH